MTATVDNRRRAMAPARTYTPEAIAALVKAAEEAAKTLRQGDAYPGARGVLEAALRPFTTEPSSWAAFCRELWGDGSFVGGHFVCTDTPRTIGEQTIAEARAAYRARYGVEP